MADEAKVLIFYLNERLELVDDVRDTAVVRVVEMNDEGAFKLTHYMVGPLEPVEEPGDSTKRQITQEDLPVEVEKAGIATVVARFGDKITAKFTRALLRRLTKKKARQFKGLLGREIQRLKGQEGFWITVGGGKKIFMPLSGITGGALAGAGTGAIAGKAAAQRGIKEDKKITERAKTNKR